MRLCDLVSRFNDPTRLVERAAVYNLLKNNHLLGKVFTAGEQAVIRPYLFDTTEGYKWPSRPLFQASNLEELKEARVEEYLDSLVLNRMTRQHPSYPKTRSNKERQFYDLLCELDFRADLLKKCSDESKDKSLALLPVSLDMLKRLREKFPKAVLTDDLAGVTEDVLKAAGFRNPARATILEYVAKKATEPATTFREIKPAQYGLFG